MRGGERHQETARSTKIHRKAVRDAETLTLALCAECYCDTEPLCKLQNPRNTTGGATTNLDTSWSCEHCSHLLAPFSRKQELSHSGLVAQIKQLLIEKQMKQRDMAQQVGCAQSGFSNWINSKLTRPTEKQYDQRVIKVLAGMCVLTATTTTPLTPIVSLVTAN